MHQCHSQAPTTAKLVESPPTPYFKLIFESCRCRLSDFGPWLEGIGGWMATVSEMVVPFPKLQSSAQRFRRGSIQASTFQRRPVIGAWVARDEVTCATSEGGAGAESSSPRMLQFSPDYLSACPLSPKRLSKSLPPSATSPQTRWRPARQTSTIFIVMEGTSRRSLVCAVRRHVLLHTWSTFANLGSLRLSAASA